MKRADTLEDIEARDRIRHDTASTLFVDAGAGSGKTSALVSRVQTLVLEDGIPIDQIAAVTFTERAAAELRDRLRERLEQASLNTARGEQRARAEAALDGLDMAAIGTLHAFAQRILVEHPIEAGIPPLLEVLDEVSSSVAFAARWSQLRTALLDDPEMAVTLEMAFATGISLDHVRSLIARLNADWDLVGSHVVDSGDPPSPQMPDVAPLLAEARRLVEHAGSCADDADKFLPDLVALSQWADGLDASGTDLQSQLTALSAARGLKWRYGRAANWDGRLPEIKGACKAWQEQSGRLVAEVTEATLRSIVHWCGSRVLTAAQERRAEGRLEFHDLLVLARDLVRGDAEVRAALHSRYRRLLLDEFQDTDPIQIEIAVRIAGGAEAVEDRWEDVTVPPGSIFVVGDPKQSIYRFRRADIGMYLRAQQVLGGQVTLSSNFRTGAPILEWVNDVFARLITEDPERQPAYKALDAVRSAPTVGPSVTVLGAEEHENGVLVDTLRGFEAADVARTIVTALTEGWTTEERTGEVTPDGAPVTRWRVLEPGDITILVPARTSLPHLETALDAAGVRYRTESSSLVYQAAEVRNLFDVVRALTDPSDAFSLVTALRSPLFGCGDDDLWTWKRGRGSFNLLAPPPEELERHIVGQAMAYLRRLYYDARWLTPSEVLGRIVVDRRMFEVAVFGPRERDSWRRLRFVIDQARAWSESEHGGLRAYLTWAAAQSAEGSRVAEAVLPESDVDSVRIMTVHAAKGLEFPMVVLSGLTSAPYNGSGVRLLWKDDGYAVALTKDLQTDDFRDQLPLDEQMGSYERLRLLYVAATRARDHLVVSLHRSGNRDTNARRLADAGAAEAAGAVQLAPSETSVTLGDLGAAGSPTPPPEYERWLSGVRASAEASRRRPAQSASGLEGTDPDAFAGASPPDLAESVDAANSDVGARDVGEGEPRLDAEAAAGLAKGPRDVEQPAWAKGRYGSAVGRAVHGALQAVDLVTGEGLTDAVTAQCVAEGVLEFQPLVTALVHSALESDVVRRAAARDHWRESYVATLQDDGTVLEGFVDLIYREDDGSLVIVDYKTDDIPPSAIAARSAYYRPQIDLYRRILRSATDAHVSHPELLFLRSPKSPEVS